MTEEEKRLQQAREGHVQWKQWGPYLSERSWGTVREDYSPDGAAWENFPHDHARSRVYRWCEDGLAGLCDDRQRLCFALALWNGRNPILKERLFGPTGNEGNHGEDVKEYYCYLDDLPTHSYMKCLYKYPQGAFPYSRLVEENRCRDRHDLEFELLDTGIFEEDRYFDVTIEYARAAPDDLLIEISALNCGHDAADLHLLPTLWFRNTWAWGYDDLIIESLQKFDYYYGSEFKVECPTGSGRMLTLWEVATELSQRLMRLFLRDERGRRSVYGGTERFQTDPRWHDLIPFHEYFHGDNGAGLGASHQTGWTGLVAKLIQQSGK